MSILPVLLALSLPVSAVALLNARREYRARGKLSAWGLTLVCLMLFVPNLLLEYATRYRWPTTLVDFAGAALAAAGLALCLAGIVHFRSMRKVLCMEPGSLTLTGPYRWGRNPQYLGWLLFVAGFAVMYWSPWCLAALLVVAVSLHLLVLIEEEHLRRVFGESYAAFCRRVPRYFGLSRSNA
jgi:protein-S-isoprenylcysteine O-methyltransferase Ste14